MTETRPFISGLAEALTWLEELISMLSGPFLTIGAGIALMGLLTDGAVLLQQPWLITAYGISQSVGVDGMLIGSSFLLARAWSRGNVGGVIGNMLLVAVLGYIVYLGGFIFNFTQAFHVDSATALLQLGIDKITWLWQRTAVGVGLVVLSGLRRYQPKVAIDLDQQLADIENKKRIDAAKRAAAAERLKGLRAMAQEALHPTPDVAPVVPDMDMSVTTTIEDDTPAAAPAALMTTAELRDYAKQILGRTLKDTEAIAIIKTVPGVTRLPAVGARKAWAAPREAVIARLHALYETQVPEAALAE